MRIEQAVFTSARTSRHQGYHLIARSSGVDDALAHSLTKWGPTHGSLVEEAIDASSLSFFTTGPGWSVIARTVYGGPEYSGRGAMQVVTWMLVLRDAQMAAYDSNPLTLIRTATPLGYLRFRAVESGQLPWLNLPEQPFTAAAPDPATAAAPDHPLIDAALQFVQRQERVALIGMQHPFGALAALLGRLSSNERKQLTFATGLKPSQHRPFQLHMLPSVDTSAYHQLSAQHIRCVRTRL